MNISVLIWDFDGTLYRQQPALWDAIRSSEIRVIMNHTGWTETQAKEAFYKIYKVETPSGTKVVSMLAHISNKQSSEESALYVDYADYLKPDPKLSAFLSSLSSFKQYLLVNGTRQSVVKGLMLLGVDRSVFSEIVTSEIVGDSKPSPKGYQYIMEKTGLPSSAHLMIGDREPVDLATAKALGMHTCLVWSDKAGEIAEFTVPTIYAVASVLGY